MAKGVAGYPAPVRAWGPERVVRTVTVGLTPATTPSHPFNLVSVLWGLKQSQWTSLALLAVAIPLLVVLRGRFPPPQRQAPRNSPG